MDDLWTGDRTLGPVRPMFESQILTVACQTLEASVSPIFNAIQSPPHSKGNFDS